MKCSPLNVTPPLCRPRRAITHFVVLLVLLAPVGKAQTPASRAFTVLATDSVAWQRVLAYVVSSLATELVAAGADAAPQPWMLRLPAEDPQRALLERQLRTLFRVRAPLPSDSVVRTLEFGRLIVVGDTAYVRVHFDLTRHCPGSAGTGGFGNVDSVVVARHPQLRAWGPARSAGVLHGDRAGCPGR